MGEHKLFWSYTDFARRTFTNKFLFRMLVNTSQQIDLWTKFFPEADPHNAMGTQYLGLLVNMFSIGSIISFFVT
jgi:hypothetical protein